MTVPDNGLTKVTVNLGPRAVAALESAMAATPGFTKTNVINFSLVAFEYLNQQVEKGAQITATYPDGTVERIKFL